MGIYDKLQLSYILASYRLEAQVQQNKYMNLNNIFINYIEN